MIDEVFTNNLMTEFMGTIRNNPEVQKEKELAVEEQKKIIQNAQKKRQNAIIQIESERQ